MKQNIIVLCTAAAVLSAFPVAALAAQPQPTPRPSVSALPGAPANVRPVATMHPLPASSVPAVTIPSPSPNGSLGSVSLADVERIALAQSPQLALARAAVEQAAAQVGIARSGALPNLSGTASTDRSKSTFRGTNSKGQLQTTNFVGTSNGASATLRQLIFDGGRVFAQIAAAHYSTDAQQLLLTRSIQTVLLTVAQQYYAALQARYTLAAALSALHVAQVQYNLVQAQYRAGVAARADVLTAELPVAQAELAVTQAQNGEASNVAALLATMGLPAQTAISLKDDTSVSTNVPIAANAVALAMNQRTDVLAAQASLNAAEAGVRAAKLGYFPSIAGTATDGANSTNNVGGNYANSWSIGASVSVPIFDGGLTRGQVQSAEAQRASAQANLTNVQLTASLNVQQALLGLQTAVSALSAANTELSQAQTVVNVTNAQYKAGVTTLPLLLNAQSQLVRAQTDQVNALYGYKVALQQLQYAEGTIGP